MEGFDLKKKEIITVKTDPVIPDCGLKKWRLETSPSNSIVYIFYILSVRSPVLAFNQSTQLCVFLL